MASMSEKLDQTLTCAICLEQYKEPKVLACLHSYCKRCLQNMVKRGKESSITCPECRQVTKLSSADVNVLQTNFFINNLLEMMTLEETTEKKHRKPLACENCDTNDEAVTRCKVCCVFLCEFCSQSHRRTRAINQHRLMTVEEVIAAGPSALAKPLNCSKHQQKTLKLFCNTCDTPICRDCIIIDHKDHNYVFLEDIFEQKKEAITKCIKKAKMRMEVLTTAIIDTEETETIVENKMAEVDKDIDNFINGLAEAVKRKQKSLKDDLKRISEEKTKRLQSKKEELSVPLATFQSCVTFAEDVLRKCDKTEILLMRKEIVQSFDEVFEKTRFVRGPDRIEKVSLVLNNEQDIDKGIANAASIRSWKIPFRSLLYSQMRYYLFET